MFQSSCHDLGWVHENDLINDFKGKMGLGTLAGGGIPPTVSTGRNLLCLVQCL